MTGQVLAESVVARRGRATARACRRWLGMTILAVLLTTLMFFGNAGALADQNPLVGLWSTTILREGNTPFATFWIAFAANGQLQERVNTTNAEMFYTGVYQLAPDGSISYRFDDYNPKTKCMENICVQIRPTMPVGQVLLARIQFVDARTFIWIDGTERLQFNRQR